MPPAKNLLRIADLDFRIAEATLGGDIPTRGPITWSLDITARERVIKGEIWEPHVYVQRYPSKAKSVEEFLRTGIKIPDGVKFVGTKTILPGGRLSCLYVFQHTYMGKVVARFERLTKKRLGLHLTARASVNWDARYGKNLPLLVEGPVQFLGLSVDAPTKAAALAMVSKRFDVEGLRYHKERGEEGSYFVPG